MKETTITINIEFKTKFPEIPKVRLLYPKGSTIKSVTFDNIQIKAKIKNPLRLFMYKVGLSINDKPTEESVIEMQFCPGCVSLLATHLIIQKPTAKGDQFSFDCCPICGCVFIPKQVLMEVFNQQKSNIIMPGAKGMNLIKGG